MIQRRRPEHVRLVRPENFKAFRRIDAEQFVTCNVNLHRGPPRRVCIQIYSELRPVQSVGSSGSAALHNAGHACGERYQAILRSVSDDLKKRLSQNLDRRRKRLPKKSPELLSGAACTYN